MPARTLMMTMQELLTPGRFVDSDAPSIEALARRVTAGLRDQIGCQEPVQEVEYAWINIGLVAPSQGYCPIYVAAVCGSRLCSTIDIRSIYREAGDDLL